MGRLALVIGRDTTGNAFPVPERGVHLGRERGDINFPDDGYVSGLHARITLRDGRVFLSDLGSSNGTLASASVPCARTIRWATGAFGARTAPARSPPRPTPGRSAGSAGRSARAGR